MKLDLPLPFGPIRTVRGPGQNSERFRMLLKPCIVIVLSSAFIPGTPWAGINRDFVSRCRQYIR